jgi:hypothetical protein
MESQELRTSAPNISKQLAGINSSFMEVPGKALEYDENYGIGSRQ